MIRVRDKYTDITWLYGSWKRNASFDSSLSTYQLRSQAYPSSSIRARGPCQNKLSTGVLNGILLPLVPLLPHKPTKRKVWFRAPGFQSFPSSMLTIAGELVWAISHGKEIAPSPFQPESSTMSLSSAGYLLGVRFLAPNVQAGQLLVERKSLLLIFVVQGPQIWTYVVASTTSQSEAC